LGPDVVLVEPIGTHDENGADPGVRYLTAVGVGAHASWAFVRYLRITAYYLDAHHPPRVSNGGLGLSGPAASDAVHTYALGFRLAPTLPITARFQAWVSAGAGWGRWEFPRMKVVPSRAAVPETCDVTTHCYNVYERADSMAHIPLGLGASFEIVPR